ncbi:MAG TPA: lipopolysaccharide biosynthesis protein [Actinomycetota bacterium]|nr:lipopolysaccharide biosynthesis protein [Actinomycetota bacterium]
MQRTVLTRVTSRILSDGSLTKKASLNAVAGGVDQLARFAVGLFVNPFLVSRLGDTAYGIWQVLQRLIGHASPAGGRPGEALKWTVAHEQASPDRERKRRQVGNAVAVWVLFLPFLAAVGAILVWFSPAWLGVGPDAVPTVRLVTAILVVDAVLFGLAYLPQSVLQGENLGYKRLGLTTSLIFLAKGLVVGVVALGWGLVGMAYVTAAMTVLTGLVYLHVCRTRVPWFGISRPRAGEVRGFVRLSWWFLVWNLVMQLMQASDVVVLGVAGSPALVTTYALAKYVPQAITVAVATLIFGIMPGLGGLIGAGDLERARRVRTETLALIWLLTTAAGAAVLLWEESFLHLWVGARYYPGAGAILVVMLMVIQFALIRTDANIIDLTLNLRRKVLLGALSAGVSLGLAWFLLARLDLGIVGLGLGFVAGRSILSVAYPSMIGRLLGVPFRRQLRAAVRPALTTVALLAATALLGPRVRVGSWFALLPSAAASAAAAAALAYLVGLPEGSRRLVRNRVRRAVRLR